MSNESVNEKMFWQRDFGEETECDKWCKIVIRCGKYVKVNQGEIKGKAQQTV